MGFNSDYAEKVSLNMSTLPTFTAFSLFIYLDNMHLIKTSKKKKKKKKMLLRFIIYKYIILKFNTFTFINCSHSKHCLTLQKLYIDKVIFPYQANRKIAVGPITRFLEYGIWYMVWPGGDEMLYGMIWRAYPGIWYGLADIAWYTTWSGGNSMV